MRKIIELNNCTSTETSEPLDINNKQSGDYGEGKVKCFDKDAFITTEDADILCSRFIKRFSDKG